MTEQTTRCGECFNCEHVAASAKHYTKSPTDRRQFRELGEMFPCEQVRPIATFWSETLGRRVTIPE